MKIFKSFKSSTKEFLGINASKGKALEICKYLAVLKPANLAIVNS